MQNRGKAQLSTAGSVQGQLSCLGPVAIIQAREPEIQTKEKEQKERAQYYVVPTTADGCQSRHPETPQCAAMWSHCKAQISAATFCQVANR